MIVRIHYFQYLSTKEKFSVELGLLSVSEIFDYFVHFYVLVSQIVKGNHQHLNFRVSAFAHVQYHFL